ncbi:MAG TPA: glutaredoxin family protein [Pseudonocardia sp.]|jgi:glutaredoxin|nr:glutaredoxin family protein [Pseudonocardia sp.]
MTGSSVVTVMTRKNCSLCDKATDAVNRICAELGVSWDSSDVDADRELRAEYGDRVPVILIDGREHGYFAVEEDRFRAALARRITDR